MVLAARLQLRQTQSLVMTPQLLQSIRLLQFTHLELERFIDGEIERNPLLDRQQEAREEEPREEAPRETAAADVAEWFETASGIDARTAAAEFDASLENVFPDDPGRVDRPGPHLAAQWKSAGAGLPFQGRDGYDIEDFADRSMTLRRHVDEEIALAFTGARDRAIATHLADGLDEIGYLRIGTDEVALRLGVAEEAVAAVLAACQQFEPAGLFARDLAECLALQLRLRDRYDPAMQAMIANLDLVARRDFSRLRRLCGVDDADLMDMLAEIRALDPRPGLAYSAGTADPVVPDILVRAAGNGGWSVELNPETLPRVLVDRSYYALASRHTKDTDGRGFLADCLHEANWLVRSLDQRARTILKVASEIVRRQDAFLLHGVRHLRPLNLRAVAEAIGMHESTVSRVTANKFMMTPRGVFELRYFFSVAIASAGGGDAHSSESVRDRIRELIEREEPESVLSDDAIVAILVGDGIDIARRTVAKYREGMGVPSSVRRRREKRMPAAAPG